MVAMIEMGSDDEMLGSVVLEGAIRGDSSRPLSRSIRASGVDYGWGKDVVGGNKARLGARRTELGILGYYERGRKYQTAKGGMRVPEGCIEGGVVGGEEGDWVYHSPNGVHRLDLAFSPFTGNFAF